MPRFDEIELRKEPAPDAPASEAAAADSVPRVQSATRIRRMLTFAADASLFVALFIAMSPLVPWHATLFESLDELLPEIVSLTGFVLVVSYYYFVLCWLIWGRTVGGAIFEVRLISESGMPVDFVAASRRWLGLLLAVLTAGIGFLPLLLPSARSLPDRISRSVPAHIEL